MESKMKEKYLGKCGVDSGQLLLTDPCYLKYFKNNEFEDERIYEWFEGGRKMVYPKDFQDYNEPIQMTQIPVTFRTMNEMIADGHYVLKKSNKPKVDYSYNGCCHISCNPDENLNDQLNGLGVCFSTSNDGEFEVYGAFNDDETLNYVKIILNQSEDDFLEDEEE
jgi:hypothetical protein